MEPQVVATQLALQGWDLDVAVAPAYVTSLRRSLVQAQQTTGTMGRATLMLTVWVALAAWCPATVRRKLSSMIWQRPGLKVRATHTPSSCLEESS
jgi:hypothetical protein